jgi:hypothetical protein
MLHIKTCETAFRADAGRHRQCSSVQPSATTVGTFGRVAEVIISVCIEKGDEKGMGEGSPGQALGSVRGPHAP